MARWQIRTAVAALTVLVAVSTHAASCSILVYHRFGPIAADATTTTTAVFAAQIEQLRAHGYRIVPLSALLQALAASVPPSANLVALTVDDGHRSVYTELYPLARREKLPLTLFIYPSAIGRAGYALNWEQLRTMQADPLIEIGSHTYWHPNFRHEHIGLGAQAYADFVARQLRDARSVLQAQLHTEVRYLAWPFGIVDPQLEIRARQAGYSAAFALGERSASASDSLFSLPRYLIADAVGVPGLLSRLARGRACTP